MLFNQVVENSIATAYTQEMGEINIIHLQEWLVKFIFIFELDRHFHFLEIACDDANGVTVLLS